MPLFTSLPWRARSGVKLDMSRFDEISREIPVLANVRPSGKFLMEDFFYAGGIRALMAQLKGPSRSHLHDGERQDHRRQHRRGPKSICPK
ncbi:MAG: dihydroxy-acid dehydratase [Pseudolabrys sp.]